MERICISIRGAVHTFRAADLVGDWRSELRLDKDGGTWIQTTLPESSESRMERTGQAEALRNGRFGWQADRDLYRPGGDVPRVEQRHEDDVARKKFLEEDVKAQVPVGLKWS